MAVRDKGYLERIRVVLPSSEKVDRIFEMLESRLEERIEAEKPLDAA